MFARATRGGSRIAQRIFTTPATSMWVRRSFSNAMINRPIRFERRNWIRWSTVLGDETGMQPSPIQSVSPSNPFDKCIEKISVVLQFLTNS